MELAHPVDIAGRDGVAAARKDGGRSCRSNVDESAPPTYAQAVRAGEGWI